MLNKLSVFAIALSAACFAVAEDYANTWGPGVGARVTVEASDQSGAARTLNDLSGEKGLVLFLSRSADW